MYEIKTKTLWEKEKSLKCILKIYDVVGIKWGKDKSVWKPKYLDVIQLFITCNQL